MPSIRSTIRLAFALVAAFSVVWSTADPAKSEQFSPPAGPLPQTTALDWPEEDLSGRMMDGAHRFVERQIADSQARSGRFWEYDTSSTTAWNTSVNDNRDRLREIIGVVDGRVCPQFSNALATTTTPRSWRRRAAIVSIRSGGRCSKAFRPKGCSFSRRARPQPTSLSCPMPGRHRSRSSASHPD